VSNLLAQGKEIKRLKKEDERRQKEMQEEDLERGEEEKGRAIEEFERTMMGLEGSTKKVGKVSGPAVEEADRSEGRGVKRKFELDEDEMFKNAKEERAKARKALDDEKVERLFLMSYCDWLTCYRPLNPPCHPSGSHLSLPPRTTRKTQNRQSYHPYVLHHRPRTNTHFPSSL